MKAIQTEYNGILFRSRLEARWAILFDALKIDWVYEPECFELSNGLKYTPDFYIDKYDLYIEIKPNNDWMGEKYHYDRYKSFSKHLVVLAGSYPSFNTFNYSNDYEMGVIFCPCRKYEPLFYSGNEVGEINELINNDLYKEELNEVKKHRFWN